MAGGEDLEAVFSEFWEWRLREWPEFASFCGDHRYDDRLNDHTENRFMTRKEAMKDFVTRCQQIKTESLSNTERMSLEYLVEELETFIRGVDSKAYVFPLSNMEGIHIDFEQCTSWMVFDTVDDYKKYVGRLEHISRRVEEDIAMLQLGIETGRTFSTHCVESVPNQVKSLEKPVTDTVFYQPFHTAKADLGPEIDTLKEQAKMLIETQILPAFKILHDFMVEKYMPACRSTPGVHGMTDGMKFYEDILHWHITMPLTPHDVHEAGVKEVARIREEMKEVLLKVGFSGDIKEFIKDLKTKDRFYYENKEDVLKAYRDMASNQIRPTLSKLFHKIPKSPLEICALPASRTSGPAAFYLAGTLDGSRSGKFFINTSNLRDNPKYEMMTLGLHEGEPGHHFQGMYAIEATDISVFRRYFEDMYYSIAPCRFGIHTAYGEGWGLYCEYLGKELGLYEDPYCLFGHLSYEMFRACRLVADTGLHYFGWNFDKAVDLFLENTTLSREAIVTECNRYCTIPGQACAYKIGQIKIQELREKARKTLGTKFDVRDFHEEVLRVGMMPMSMLEQVIDDYIHVATLSK